LPRFKRLLDDAARKHLVVQLGYMYRYNPAVVFLRDALRMGWLGEPFEVHAVMSKVIGAPQRRDLAAFKGGMMFELGCHIIDLVVGVLGRPASVTPFKQHVAPVDDGLMDNMLAVFTYPRAIATVKSSAMEVEGFGRRHLVVCGSEGTCHIEPLDKPAVRLALSKPRDKYRQGYQEIPFGDYPRYTGDAADLARIIRGEKDADFSHEHDLAAQETLLRACGVGVER
jgi:predicted dehydrogenase